MVGGGKHGLAAFDRLAEADLKIGHEMREGDGKGEQVWGIARGVESVLSLDRPGIFAGDARDESEGLESVPAGERGRCRLHGQGLLTQETRPPGGIGLDEAGDEMVAGMETALAPDEERLRALAVFEEQRQPFGREGQRVGDQQVPAGLHDLTRLVKGTVYLAQDDRTTVIVINLKATSQVEAGASEDVGRRRRLACRYR